MVAPTSSTIVQRLWNYCNILRDDGISHLQWRWSCDRAMMGGG
jgi:hypothetical protein